MLPAALFGLVCFLITTIILLIFVLEDRERRIGRPLRRWRYAFSRRKQSAAALERARRAQFEAVTAKDLAERIAAHSRDAIAKMGSYIIAEQSGEHIKGIRANNYEAKKKKIRRSIEVAESNGYSLPRDERQQLNRMLAEAHKKAIRIEREKEKQAAIKAEIREEQKRQAEIDRAIRQAEKEERIKRMALQEAIKLLGDTHSEQIEQLKAELAEAQARMERAKSMAQQTKAGHIYVISNIGSFGPDVFKVGMTRRLEPMQRVFELGDASVPFGFDVHAMFSSEDAPALEAALHRDLEPHRVNKVNYRKEFFRADIHSIIASVKRHHGEVDYEVDPEALEYFESVNQQPDSVLG